MKKLVFRFIDQAGKTSTFSVSNIKDGMEAEEAKTAGETILGTKVLVSKYGQLVSLDRVEEVETNSKVFFDKDQE